MEMPVHLLLEGFQMARVSQRVLGHQHSNSSLASWSFPHLGSQEGTSKEMGILNTMGEQQEIGGAWSGKLPPLCWCPGTAQIN